MSIRVGPPGALAFALVGVAGCGLASSPTPDDLSSWQASPMRPDPGLAATASTHEWCRSRSTFLNATLPPPLEGPLQVVLQDRRTPMTAGFIVATAGYVGSCLISPGGDGFGSLGEGTLAQIGEGISVDGGGSGLLGARSGAWVWGRSEARIASIAIDLTGDLHAPDHDDRVVRASVLNGYWLGWWPEPGVAFLIIARDAQSKVVASMQQSDNGWVAH